MSENCEREERQKMFIRVCRDSRFKMDPASAARFAAKLLGTHPILIWTALGLDTMEAIANGTHPSVSDPRYDNRRNPIKSGGTP